MTYSWKDWEGRTVDGKFVLANYLGGSESAAVFRTALSAAIPRQMMSRSDWFP